MRFKIYIIENLINGKVYVGKTSDVKKRWAKHKSNARRYVNRRLYDSMNFYGYDNFLVSVIDESDCENDINNKERFYIEFYKSTFKEFGYNMTPGGDGGNTISHYNEIQMSEYLGKLKKLRSGSNFKHTEETKKIMSEEATGRKLSEETKNKISEKIKSKINSGEYKPNISGLKKGQLGKFKHSEASRKKISDCRKNKTYDEIYGGKKSILIKNKHSEAWMGSKNPNYQHIEKDDLFNHLKNGMQTKKLACLYGVTEQTIINKCKKFFNKKPQEIRDGKN